MDQRPFLTYLALVLGSALAASQALSADFTGVIVGITDGDPITVLHRGAKRNPWSHEKPIPPWVYRHR